MGAVIEFRRKTTLATEVREANHTPWNAEEIGNQAREFAMMIDEGKSPDPMALHDYFLFIAHTFAPLDFNLDGLPFDQVTNVSYHPTQNLIYIPWR